MKQKSRAIPLMPPEILSDRQMQIYQLYCRGMANKEIARKLSLDPRVVATQLSRIKKKAANLNFTYKIEPGAEYAHLQHQLNSPAEQLKKKFREDPGFFSLMFDRYASNDEPAGENRFRLASAGFNPELLSSARARRLKIIAISGRNSGKATLAVKIDRKDRQVLKHFLEENKIRPVETYWDDGSAIYLLSPRDLRKIQQLLGNFPGEIYTR